MSATVTAADGIEYPARKQGKRWVCDGPRGRFSARSRTELQRLLRETGGRYDQAAHPDSVVREWRA